MADDTQKLCNASPTQRPISKTPRDVAFSPSHVQISFIDDDEDNLISDMSEASSCEVKTQVDQDQVLSLPTKTDPSINIHSPCQNPTDEIPSESIPQKEVPSQQVIHKEHSNQSISCETKLPNDFQIALQPKENIQDSENSTVIPNGQEKNSIHSETLEESVAKLKTILANRTAVSVFEKLAKTNSSATMDTAKLPENVNKNRYKDVLPYDESRVPLKDWKKSDYINASFIRMQVPPLWITNEYIATQGPLPHTCNEFWLMVWEQKCQIIVMVTTLKERNRVKCHKYWPDLYEILTFEQLQVTCFREVVTDTSITRDLLMISNLTNEERHVVHVQHVTWPDHGVPGDASDFLNFVQDVRNLRQSLGGKIIVHCSAGVGRTGVLILMETSMCYIEAGEPLYPEEFIKALREQRVMMVQTASQYKFICEAIVKVYNDFTMKQSGVNNR